MIVPKFSPICNLSWKEHFILQENVFQQCHLPIYNGSLNLLRIDIQQTSVLDSQQWQFLFASDELCTVLKRRAKDQDSGFVQLIKHSMIFLTGDHGASQGTSESFRDNGDEKNKIFGVYGEMVQVRGNSSKRLNESIIHNCLFSYNPCSGGMPVGVTVLLWLSSTPLT